MEKNIPISIDKHYQNQIQGYMLVPNASCYQSFKKTAQSADRSPKPTCSLITFIVNTSLPLECLNIDTMYVLIWSKENQTSLIRYHPLYH